MSLLRAHYHLKWVHWQLMWVWTSSYCQIMWPQILLDCRSWCLSLRAATDNKRQVIFHKATIEKSDGQIGGLIGAILDITDRRKNEQERDKLLEELKKALKEIKTLKGIIPICSYCKQIRDEKGAWDRMEAYICSHSDAQFSHGICPECYDKHKDD